MTTGRFSLLIIITGIVLSSCTANNADVDDNIRKYFEAKRVDGCFTMLNNADGKITVYNMALDTQRFLPASTFKILNGMIGLQTGIISSEKMVIPWDRQRRPNKDWNKNMDMTEAFKVSNVPWFQEVARRIGRDTLQQWVDSIGYGNKIITGPIDSFWLNNSLKISPDEQLGLLKKLYFDQLPFRKSVQDTMRQLMLQEDNTAYKLSYKTGLGFNESGENIGWVCGWIEENRHVYFFVTLIKAPADKSDMQSVRLDITKDILKHYGFFEGKK